MFKMTVSRIALAQDKKWRVNKKKRHDLKGFCCFSFFISFYYSFRAFFNSLQKVKKKAIYFRDRCSVCAYQELHNFE